MDDDFEGSLEDMQQDPNAQSGESTSGIPGSERCMIDLLHCFACLAGLQRGEMVGHEELHVGRA